MWLLVIEPITWFMLTLGVNYFALAGSFPWFIIHGIGIALSMIYYNKLVVSY